MYSEAVLVSYKNPSKNVVWNVTTLSTALLKGVSTPLTVLVFLFSNLKRKKEISQDLFIKPIDSILKFPQSLFSVFS